MTRRFLSSLAVAVAVCAASVAAAEKYGAGVSLTETTPIERILQNPASFEGKTVRVDGRVTAVCEHMGCWMALAPVNGPESSPTLMIKVDDGVIVFPVSAKGRRVTAQGVIQKVGGDAEGQSAAAEHAKQTGKAAPAAASWQLKASGAEIN
jgi:hypothetical protein